MSVDRVARVTLTLGSLLALSFGLAAYRAAGRVPTGEHSLEHAFGISVDVNGNIYCGIPRSSRVQAYDREGRFLWATRIDAADGTFRLRAQESGGVEVAAVRNKHLYEISASREVVSEQIRPEAYAAFGKVNEFAATDTAGQEYELTNRAILKRDRNGAVTFVVKQPWWPWWFIGGVPPWVSLGLAAAWGFLALIWQPAFGDALRFLARLRWR